MKNKFNNQGFSTILLLLVLIIAIALGGFFFLSQQTPIQFNNEEFVSNNQEKELSTRLDLKSLVSNVKNLYGGTIDWSKIKDKPAYEFYTRDINGLALINYGIQTAYDSNYAPTTKFIYQDLSIPVKNSLISYYQVPEELSDQFKVSKNKSAVPIELVINEFDRKLTLSENEKFVGLFSSYCQSQNTNAFEDKYSDKDLFIHYCDLNTSSENNNNTKVEDSPFDSTVFLYMIDKSLLIRMSFNSSYISDPNPYLEDFLSKQFNSNLELFSDSSKVRGISDAKRFEEWIQNTFKK